MGMVEKEKNIEKTNFFDARMGKALVTNGAKLVTNGNLYVRKNGTGLTKMRF